EPQCNYLAGVFIEALFEQTSPRWMHLQVSSVNELILQKLRARSGRRINTWGRLMPGLGRLMVAYCGLHSDHSHELELRLLPQTRNGRHVLSSLLRDVNETEAVARRLASRIAAIGPKFRSLFLWRMMRFYAAGATGHNGGSFPMRHVPKMQFDCDVLGRPFGWKRIHLIDASVFPSIPGTTVALLIMANAHRIATKADLD